MVVAVILLSIGVHLFYLAVNYLVVCTFMKVRGVGCLKYNLRGMCSSAFPDKL
jgi:hypothetical protein